MTMTSIGIWHAIISRNCIIAPLSSEIAARIVMQPIFVLQLQASQFEADLRLIYVRERPGRDEAKH